MDEIALLIQEYARLRLNGLATREAIQALNAHLQTLNAEDVVHLQNEIRAWEKHRTEFVISPQQRQMLQQTSEQDQKISCPVCETLNDTTERYCSACGQTLDAEASKRDTLIITKEDFSTYYDTDSHIILETEDGLQIKIRPQDYERGIVLGRDTRNGSTRPDVDLTDLGAMTKGVSRLHLALIYNQTEYAIRLHDMGSANGTYLDDRRIHPAERLLLSHGRTLRLGMLPLKVHYVTSRP